MQPQKTSLNEISAETAAAWAQASRATISRWVSSIPGLGRTVKVPGGGKPRLLINPDKLARLIALRDRPGGRDIMPRGIITPKAEAAAAIVGGVGSVRANATVLPAAGSAAKKPRYPQKLPAVPADYGLTFAQAAKLLAVDHETIRLWANTFLRLKVKVPGDRRQMVDPLLLIMVDQMRDPDDGKLWLSRIDPAEPLRQARRTAVWSRRLNKKLGIGPEDSPETMMASVWRVLQRIERYRNRPPDDAAATEQSFDGGRHDDR